MGVPQRLASLPGTVFVGEVYAFAERRMARLPQFDENVRARDAQVLLLQFDERRRRRMVVPCDFETEPVGLVFGVTREGKSDWPDDQEIGAEEQDDQRQ